MDVTFANDLSQVSADVLVALAVDNGSSEKPAPRLLTSHAATSALAEPLFGTDVTGKAHEAAWFYSPQGLATKRLLVLGAGKAAKFDPNAARMAAGTAIRLARSKGLETVAIILPESTVQHFSDANFVRGLVIGAILADFDPNYYASDRKPQSVRQLILVGHDEAAIRKAAEEARIIGESQNFTRDLVNEPGNKMTPTILGQRAAAMAKEVGLACEVHSTDKLKELKMGSFLSVTLGSEEPPALIVLRYEPKDVSSDLTVGLVGKGITFDTGGISIKPADNMEKMKYDMAGGASMLGAMRAIALLKPNVRVVCVVCATENMPDGKAQKPGDVQFAMNGKAIEIINTDAEGRLVLADGLCYARQLGATHLVDAATLTGAVSVALGQINAGLFASDDDIYERFRQAAHHAGERFWRLPLDDEYREQIKSDIADIKNTGGRYAGSVTAAKFLQEFVEDRPWIHLDIAGTAWNDENRPFLSKGPTGISVRTLIEFVRSFAR